MDRVMADLARLKKKHKGSRHRVEIPNYREDNAPKLSNSLDFQGGYKRDPLAYRWKRGREEAPDTIREIEVKKKRTAPLFNKGAAQYITPGTDPHTIGRK